MRSVVVPARTILLISGLPENIWAEAVITSIHILNRIPFQKDLSPYENQPQLIEEI